jgi:hypothetical protein
MLTINNYSNDYYSLDIPYGDILFLEYIELFKKIYLTYEKPSHTWFCSTNKYFELVAWLDYYKYPYNRPNKIIKIYEDSSLKIKRNNVFTKTEESEILNSEYSLYNYQLEDLNRMVKKNMNLVFSDPGTGKTLEAISYFSYFYFKKETDCIIILAESGLLYHWKKEVLLYSKIFKESEIVLIDNSNKKDSKSLLSDTSKKIYIIAHHILQDIVLLLLDKNLVKNNGDKIKKSNLKWITFECDLKKYTNRENLSLIVDECHRFKNSSSILSKSLRCVKNSFYYKLIMSATPFIVHFEDLWNQVSILDNNIIDMSEEEFKIRISLSIGNKYGIYAINRYDSNKIKEIQESLASITVKRIKTDLPEMQFKSIINPIYFQFPIKYRQIYDAISKDEFLKIKDSGVDGITLENLNTKFPYIVQLLDNPLLLKGKLQNDYPEIQGLIDKLKFDNDPKVEFLDEFLSDLIDNQNSKCVIYDVHPLTLNLLRERYAKKYKCETIHGEVNLTKEEKDRIISNFNNKTSDCKLLALSFLTSSSGLNLNESCNNLVVYSVPNNPMLWRQAIDRIYRINNKKDANIYTLLYDKTYDLVRYESTINRVKFNEIYMNKNLSVEEIESYLNIKTY